MDQFEAAQAGRPYLLAGERVLWSGQPKQGLSLGSRDALLIPFSLMWGGFAIFWNAAVWLGPFGAEGDTPPLFFRLWGLPFLAIGLYLILGRFFHDAWLRKRLAYAVTDQRIVILRGNKITSLDIARLPRLQLSENGDGTGTLAFEASGPLGFGRMKGFGPWIPALNSSAEFFRIPGARSVYELIRKQGTSA